MPRTHPTLNKKHSLQVKRVKSHQRKLVGTPHETKSQTRLSRNQNHPRYEEKEHEH